MSVLHTFKKTQEFRMLLCHKMGFIWVSSLRAGYQASRTYRNTERRRRITYNLSGYPEAVASTHTHTHTLLNPNIFGSTVHTRPITETDTFIQHDTNLLITLDGCDIGLEGKLRSEVAHFGCLPAYTASFGVCVQLYIHKKL